MIVAVLDLGTNTFHLIIADLSASKPDILFKSNVPVKLGEGRINENIIIPAAFERGITALKVFKEEIDKHQVGMVKAIATSAIRSAANGQDFVRAALERADIEITVIDGDQEATYIYEGVKATGVIEATSLIMDIGGGSTEFIICNQEEIFWKKSYNIGAARMQQAYFKSDAISADDRLAISERLKTELAELRVACKRYKPTQLIGSAGAFETFATMIDEHIDVSQLKSIPIIIHKYQELSQKLIASTHREREQFKGLIKLRVDTIVIASLITNYVLELANVERLSLSTYDLKMGVLSALRRLNA